MSLSRQGLREKIIDGGPFLSSSWASQDCGLKAADVNTFAWISPRKQGHKLNSVQTICDFVFYWTTVLLELPKKVIKCFKASSEMRHSFKLWSTLFFDNARKVCIWLMTQFKISPTWQKQNLNIVSLFWKLTHWFTQMNL